MLTILFLHRNMNPNQHLDLRRVVEELRQEDSYVAFYPITGGEDRGVEEEI